MDHVGDTARGWLGRRCLWCEIYRESLAHEPGLVYDLTLSRAFGRQTRVGATLVTGVSVSCAAGCLLNLGFDSEG